MGFSPDTLKQSEIIDTKINNQTIDLPETKKKTFVET